MSEILEEDQEESPTHSMRGSSSQTYDAAPEGNDDEEEDLSADGDESQAEFHEVETNAFDEDLEAAELERLKGSAKSDSQKDDDVGV